MPDTSAARAAIRLAYEKHRAVMGGLSTAQLKLEAAAGQFVGDKPPPRWPPDSPVWIEHALDGLEGALSSCMSLQDAIRAAIRQTGDLRPDQEVHRA